MALIVREAQEQSIAQTRSFSSMLVLAQAWAWLLANGEHLQTLSSLPAIGDRLISENLDLAQQLGEDRGLDRFFFLGSGPQYGLACEAMLKMKEMSLSYSEAFPFMEFRHGPMSMVNDATLIVGLLSDAARDYEVAVLEEMRALGARTLRRARNLCQRTI
jgi:glucosamine--fructose-6-phosphate aminotransferase (isomerizing)